jgi:hypothetical protein
VRRAVCAAISLGLTACAGEAALDRSAGWGGHPVAVSVADVPVKGYTVKVETLDGECEGELLTADASLVRVLDGDAVTRTFSWPRIRSVRVEVVPRQEGVTAGMTILTMLGTLSTVSHGYFLVFTAPAWLAAGIPSTIMTNRPLRGEATESGALELYQFARFPQGLPATWVRKPTEAPAPAEQAGTGAGM